MYLLANWISSLLPGSLREEEVEGEIAALVLALKSARDSCGVNLGLVPSFGSGRVKVADKANAGLRREREAEAESVVSDTCMFGGVVRLVLKEERAEWREEAG